MYVIQYMTGPSASEAVYYSVERGDFGALDDCTPFRIAADAKMVKLRLHEVRALSLQRLSVQPAQVQAFPRLERTG